MKKRKLLIIGAIILLPIILVAVILAMIPNPFHDQVTALLDDTGATYTLHDCSGGWTSRQVHCEILISPSELPKLIQSWDLNAKLPRFEESTRLIALPEDQNPCDSALRQKYAAAFEVQQWSPARYGFDSVIVFFNQKTQRACIFLSIAYG